MTDIFNAKEYIENFLKIRAKSGEIIPFKLKPSQIKLHEALAKQDAEGKPMRAIVLKARQLGFSTYTEARIFQRAATSENHRAMILAHRDDSTTELFNMFKLFYAELPSLLRPMKAKDNDGEMLFDNPSRSQKERDRHPGLRSSITCSTAGTGGGVGRGSTFKSVHCSEYAFWRGDKQETLLGILQAVPAEKGTLVIIESTANGFDRFQKLWEQAEKGENDFVPVFCAWHEEETYRMPVPPGTIWTEKEKELRERFKLDNEQLVWRRWCIKNNCGGDERLFRQEYPSSPEEAFLTTGTGVFDNETVMAQIKAAPRAIAIGEFEYDYDGAEIKNIRWVEKENGKIKLYEMPETGVPYVLGGDTAGEGSDRFTGQMLNNTNGAQAAVLKMQEDEVEYTRQILCFGRFYNNALIGIEINFTTYPQRELERLGYSNFYQRERYDSIRHELRKSYGFRTTMQSKRVIISGLKRLMQENPELVRDRETLKEMLTFVELDGGRCGAMNGEHDDLVMAFAIAHEIRGQQSFEKAEEKPEERHRLGEELKKQQKKKKRSGK